MKIIKKQKKYSENKAILTYLVIVKVLQQHNRFTFSLYNSDLAILYYTKIQKYERKKCNVMKGEPNKEKRKVNNTLFATSFKMCSKN